MAASPVGKVLASPTKAAGGAVMLMVLLLLQTACQGFVPSEQPSERPFHQKEEWLRLLFAFNFSIALFSYEVIEKAKTEVEKICPGVVSCADIIAVAARDATQYVGVPSILDSEAVKTRLKNWKSISSQAGYTAMALALMLDLLALAVAGIVVQFKEKMKIRLDVVTPDTFDNIYFKNLMQKKGHFESDQLLLSGGPIDNVVMEYRRNPQTFNSDFAFAITKIGDFELLTGEIRRICSAITSLSFVASAGTHV